MSRPASLDLTDLAAQRWRYVPMPGSNGGIELVPLASATGLFTIVGRFRAGFERLATGGYRASEEFLLLEGELELEGVTYRRGDLTVVPADYARTEMRSPSGCVLLAWFGGPADFRSADELGECHDIIASIPTVGATAGLPSSDVADWTVGDPLVSNGGAAVVEVVDAGLTRWVRDPAEAPVATDLVRRER